MTTLTELLTSLEDVLKALAEDGVAVQGWTVEDEQPGQDYAARTAGNSHILIIQGQDGDISAWYNGTRYPALPPAQELL